MPEQVPLMAAIIYGHMYGADNTPTRDEDWKEDSRMRQAVRIARLLSHINRNWGKR